MTAGRGNGSSATGPWSEDFAASGQPRKLYRELLEELAGREIGPVKARANQRLRELGASFGETPLAVCPIPRLIQAGDWEWLSGALAQRTRALSAFVDDAYDRRAIVAAGIVPERVIEEAEGYEPELQGCRPTAAAPLGVIGFDIVRGSSGELLVLEDNVRSPSGYTYAVAVRKAVAGALRPVLPLAAANLRGAAQPDRPLVGALQAVLGDASATVAPPAGGEPLAVVVLSDGPASSAFFEHRTAARWLNAPLVTLAELERRGSELWLRRSAGGQRVGAVYLRTAVDRLRAVDGRPTDVGAMLLEPWLAGAVAVVNGFGAGVADDKLAHAYVEDMIRFYLGEEPNLRSVPTLDLGEPETAEQVLDDLRGFVVKPRHGHGGHGVVVCAHAGRDDLRAVAAQLRSPETAAGYIAQRTVALSVLSTAVDDGIAERHIDLRPFAFSTRAEIRVPPAALTRVAWDAGALVVNSSQAGGAKDTWILP